MKYDELFAPDVGPENPFLTQQQKAKKNMLSGFVEQAHISEFQFENQRRTFSSYGMLKLKSHQMMYILSYVKILKGFFRKDSYVIVGTIIIYYGTILYFKYFYNYKF